MNNAIVCGVAWLDWGSGGSGGTADDEGSRDGATSQFAEDRDLPVELQQLSLESQSPLKIVEMSAAEITAPTDTLSYHTPDDRERIDALKLLADSVAQQRQIQNSALLWHPATMSLLVLLVGIIVKMNWESAFGTVLLLTCGGVMAAFSMLGRFTVGWLEIAEEVGSGKGLKILESKEVVVAVWRNEVIGVIAWSQEKEKEETVLKVWGFTVRRRERGRGVGGDLVRTMVDQVLHKSPNGKLRVEPDKENICKWSKLS